MKNIDPIFVTEPSLAPLKEYVKLLEGFGKEKF